MINRIIFTKDNNQKQPNRENSGLFTMSTIYNIIVNVFDFVIGSNETMMCRNGDKIRVSVVSSRASLHLSSKYRIRKVIEEKKEKMIKIQSKEMDRAVESEMVQEQLNNTTSDNTKKDINLDVEEVLLKCNTYLIENNMETEKKVYFKEETKKVYFDRKIIGHVCHESVIEIPLKPCSSDSLFAWVIYYTSNELRN